MSPQIKISKILALVLLGISSSIQAAPINNEWVPASNRIPTTGLVTIDLGTQSILSFSVATVPALSFSAADWSFAVRINDFSIGAAPPAQLRVTGRVTMC